MWRYLLTEETKDLLEIYTVEKYGELQSIEIFNHFIRNDGFRGINLEDYAFYDSGNPVDWLKGAD